MPRLEDALAYAAFSLLGLGIVLGGWAFWLVENSFRGGDAQRLLLLGAAACAGAVASVVVSAKMAERRLRREERSGKGRMTFD
ncbi:hypothetical protein [Plastoroseomonas hellenica]|uniref:Uncharacterized protein n=1 Tax=Plastoroseomonas hellenica TaxID=2687306 RepID=A0ABS5F8J2_9PROT|nr:hypothetical protein [Plastoroseomonas hellenica]MBR0647211.1 hypothetical protein [Plastoroseomonas hellenica]MBR0668886.1 hypothetical protein [Plastoroseomonas hellenica]